MNETGEFLKKRREELGLTQSEVATRAGISVSYLSTLERGQRHSITNAKLTPDRSKVVSIAKALQTDKDELLVMFGFAPEQPLERPKPQTVQELLERLTELGVDYDPSFLGGVENIPDDPDFLADVLADFAMLFEMRVRKKLHPQNEQATRGILP